MLPQLRRYGHAGTTSLLLHGGMASTSAVWAGYGWSWYDALPAFARHFHVIAPDTRVRRDPGPG